MRRSERGVRVGVFGRAGSFLCRSYGHGGYRLEVLLLVGWKMEAVSELEAVVSLYRREVFDGVMVVVRLVRLCWVMKG